MRQLSGSGFKLAVVGALLLGLVFGVVGVRSANFHGIAFSKTCVDPTLVGSALECSFRITNDDDGNNPEIIFSLSDVVQASGGAVPTGNLLPSLELVFAPTSGAGAPSC